MDYPVGKLGICLGACKVKGPKQPTGVSL